MLLFNCPVGRILNIIHTILIIITIYLLLLLLFEFPAIVPFFFNSTPTVTQLRFQMQTCQNHLSGRNHAILRLRNQRLRDDGRLLKPSNLL